jgi:hypothetical protein
MTEPTGSRDDTPPADDTHEPMPIGPETTLSSRLPRASLVRDSQTLIIPRPRRVGRQAVIGMVAGLLFALLGIGAVGTIGAAGIDRAERNDRIAEQSLYAGIARASVVLDRPLDTTHRDELAGLFDAVTRSTDPAFRRASATRLVDLLALEAHELGQRQLASEDAQRHGLEEAVRNLRRLEQDRDRQAQELAEARASFPGRVASLFLGQSVRDP